MSTTCTGPEGRKQDENNRRSRGLVSCAECRRLKVKCDKGLPCSSCSKRGCAAICPNGTLAAGPGTRFILADTQHLHEKIEAMSKRIAELEDALAALQSQISNEKHPLLSGDLVLVKAPPLTEQVTATPVSDATDKLAENLGTLTLGERVHFFGQHAAADYVITEESLSETPASTVSLPLDILLLAGAFPMSTIRERREQVTVELARWLPASSQASTLVQAFYINSTWMFNLIPEEEFNETIFSRVYAAAIPDVTQITPHDLGVLFLVLAVGCLVDLDRPPYNAEGSNYYQLARASLGLDSVIDHPTIQAIRALHLMAMFLQMCDHSNSATACYSIMGLTAQLCHGLGLHRDDTQWNLSEGERRDRRNLFWEFVSFNAWTSFALGRPGSLSLAHVDAKVAANSQQFLDSEGKWHDSLRFWSHSFVQQVLLTVMDQAFGVKPPTYATVMRLDRLVREHGLCERLRSTTECSGEPTVAMGLLLQRNTLFALTQKLLLFLHRSFFADALMEHPDDPLKSKYAQSVLAAFRSAFYITTTVRAVYAQAPLSLRYWVFCTQSFSACLVLGSIIIKSPGCGLAPPAWVELDRMYELFEQVSQQSQRIAHIMPELRKLRSKAHEAYTAFTTKSGDPARLIDPEDTSLQLLWGQTKTRLPDNSSKPRPLSATDGPSALSSSVTLPGSNFAESSSVHGAPFSSDVSQSLSTAGPVFTGQGLLPSVPSDDAFAALYSSFFPVNPQPEYSFDPEVFQSAPMPSLDFQGIPFTQTQGLDPSMLDGLTAVSQWNHDFDNVAMMSAPTAARNLDIPWQSFMSSIGLTSSPDNSLDQQRQQQQQQSYDGGVQGY